MTTAIIVAAGRSTRMGAGIDKAFLSLVNKPVIAWSLLAFERCADIDRIVLVVRKDQIMASKAVVKMFGISKLDKIVAGRARRQDSVKAGLEACELDTRYVLVHDGARPCIASETISEVVAAVKRQPAVTLARRVTDTLKRVPKGVIVAGTEDRSKLWSAQTPQGFQMGVLRKAYAALKEEVSDDCQAVELAGEVVRVIENNKPNFKITTAEDLQLAAAILK